MTDTDLRVILREHIATTEPPFTLRPEDITRSHLHGRHRRAYTLGAIAAVAAAVVTLAMVPQLQSSPDSPPAAAAPNFHKAAAMPHVIDTNIRSLVEPYLTLGPRQFTASGGGDQTLAESRWDEAEWMITSYGWDTGHRLRVSLGHARSEAEGDRERMCRENLAAPAGHLHACQTTALEDGTVVASEIYAATPPSEAWNQATWVLLTRQDLQDGTVRQTARHDKEPLDPSRIFFVRSVEAVRSDTYLVDVQEVVQAPTYEAAIRRFTVPEDVLTTLATHPQLVIPQPTSNSKAP